MKDEALKLALEAITQYLAESPDASEEAVEGLCDAASAARKALAQPEQCQCPNCKVTLHASDCAVHNEPAHPKGECNCGAQQYNATSDHRLMENAQGDLERIKLVQTGVGIGKPEQEPVAVKHMMEWVDYLKRKSDYGQHLQIPSEMSAGACWDLARELEQFINTTPPQRTWQGLTDEHPLMVFAKECVLGAYQESELADAAKRAIEAAHGIKE